ncbi:MAG: hypothetical protein J7484_01275 [Microbacterium sp.]|nr:hypothetical protein [Microbacterium sp.]
MNIDRKMRTPARLLMALPIAALAVSLSACGASRPTEAQVEKGLTKYFEEAGLGDSLPEDAASCFAGHLVDSKLSNETLSYIADGKDQVSSVEDRDLSFKIIQDNLEECMS